MASPETEDPVFSAYTDAGWKVSDLVLNEIGTSAAQVNTSVIAKNMIATLVVFILYFFHTWYHICMVVWLL